jgi:hypothetical protein
MLLDGYPLNQISGTKCMAFVMYPLYLLCNSFRGNIVVFVV